MTETDLNSAGGPRAPRRATAGGEAAGTRWASLARWRDWSIPVKLAAVTLVPVVFAVVLGVLQIGGQVDRADSYRQVDRLVAVNENMRKVLTWLQRERNKAAILLTTGSRDIAFEITAEQQSVNGARDALVRAIERTSFDNEVTRVRYTEVTERFAELDALRAQVARSSIDGSAALTGYSKVIRALIGFDRAAAEEVADPALAGTAGALHDLEAAKEEVYFQQGTVAVGIARGGLTAAELDALGSSQSRLEDRTADFRAIATPRQQAEYDRLISVPGVAKRVELLRLVLGDGTGGQAAQVGVPLPLTSVDWNGAAELTSGRISNVSSQLGAEIKKRSADLQDAASDAAGLAAVVLLVALVAAAAIMIIIGRQLLRSLSTLRRSALDVAERGLPDAVARIREGKDVPTRPEVDAVDVHTGDEIGQVARAFDEVHQQALRLATEQAGLRANYADVFVNLSRRSQGLVQRQLQLLERLERDEEDADQLATLFQLDHLATRMRRNNENLMVLSGGDLARRGQQPVNLADLLRAAVSEIEQYQRVVIAPTPVVLVVGYAVGDLVRLTAELLDNATAFSAPATQVTVATDHVEGGSVRVEVIDRGIGMTERELAEVNARLADTGSVDASTSRRMGLYVVGRLAGRHGIRVRLVRVGEIGLRAEITIPADLVTSNVVDLAPMPAPTPAPAEPDVPRQREAPRPALEETQEWRPTTTGDGPSLPRRANGSNGHRAAEPDEPPRTNGSRAGNGNHVNGHDTAPKVPELSAPQAPTPPPERDPNPTDIIPAQPDGPVEPVEGLINGRPPADPAPRGANGSARRPNTTNGSSANGTRAAGTNGSTAPGSATPGDAGQRRQTTANGSDAPVGPAATNGSAANGSGATTGSATANGSAPTKGSAATNGSAASNGSSGGKESAGNGSSDTRGSARTNGSGATKGSAANGSAARTPLPRRDAQPPREWGPPAATGDGRDLFAAQEQDNGWWDTTAVQRKVSVHETTPIFDEMVSAWFRAATDDPDFTAEDARAWDFAADRGFTTARAVSANEPETFTHNGLPRRTPRQNLVPGSVQRGDGRTPTRDANDLRERLSSFQRGVHRARGVHHSGPAHAEGIDLRGARWRFAADVGWRAANPGAAPGAASGLGSGEPEPEPPTTTGGLPRRTPRERLLPGSLDAAGAPAEPPRIARDAEALRNRLGSFQRGIGRGRDDLAQRGAGDKAGERDA